MRMRISRRSWLGREAGEGRGGVFWLTGREVWLLLGCRLKPGLFVERQPKGRLKGWNSDG